MTAKALQDALHAVLPVESPSGRTTLYCLGVETRDDGWYPSFRYVGMDPSGARVGPHADVLRWGGPGDDPQMLARVAQLTATAVLSLYTARTVSAMAPRDLLRGPLEPGVTEPAAVISRRIGRLPVRWGPLATGFGPYELATQDWEGVVTGPHGTRLVSLLMEVNDDLRVDLELAGHWKALDVVAVAFPDERDEETIVAYRQACAAFHRCMLHLPEAPHVLAPTDWYAPDLLDAPDADRAHEILAGLFDRDVVRGCLG